MNDIYMSGGDELLVKRYGGVICLRRLYGSVRL